MHRKKGYVLLNVCVILTVCIILTSCIFKLALDDIKRVGIEEFERNSFNITEKEEKYIIMLQDFINTDLTTKQKILDKKFSSMEAIRFKGDNAMQAIFGEKYVIWKSYEDPDGMVFTYERVLGYEIINTDEGVYIDLKILNRRN